MLNVVIVAGLLSCTSGALMWLPGGFTPQSLCGAQPVFPQVIFVAFLMDMKFTFSFF